MTRTGSDMRRRILLGEIGAAHGIRGEVVIRTYTEAPESIASYGPLEDESGQRRISILPVRVTPKGLIARIEGIADRTAVEKMRGIKLFIARERLPIPAANEYYHSDLVGLAAVDAGGKAIGSVAGIHDFGAGTIIEIKLEGSDRTEMIPFTNAIVPEVDIENGKIVIVLPATTEIEGEE